MGKDYIASLGGTVTNFKNKAGETEFSYIDAEGKA
jgi:hypothetical protein